MPSRLGKDDYRRIAVYPLDFVRLIGKDYPAFFLLYDIIGVVDRQDEVSVERDYQFSRVVKMLEPVVLARVPEPLPTDLMLENNIRFHIVSPVCIN